MKVICESFHTTLRPSEGENPATASAGGVLLGRFQLEKIQFHACYSIHANAAVFHWIK